MSELNVESYAQYAIDLVKTICEQVGPGLPGSSQEKDRAAIIEKELKIHLGDNNVKSEKFKLSPWAYVSSYPLSSILLLTSVIFNVSFNIGSGIMPWITSITSLLFSILSILLFLFEFILGYELIDVFFKKRWSVNITGTLRKPDTKKINRVLLLSGHHDSAPENTWLGFLGYGFLVLSSTFFIGLIVMFAISSLQVIGLIIDNTNVVRFGTIGWIVFTYPILPSILFGLFFNRGKKNGGTVPGAADNLSASSIVVSFCKFLSNNPSYIPDDTEIRFVSFGSEEAGCRGSKRYVKLHHNELKLFDAHLLNLETIAHPEITILTSDTNGTVKNSSKIIKSVISAAERAKIPFKVKPAFIGVANDSGPFSKSGINALTILSFKFPEQFIQFYHQKKDNPDVLTIEPMSNVFKLLLEWIKNNGN